MFNPQLDELQSYKIERRCHEVRENFSGVTWTEVPMIDLKAGDIFRAWDSGGTLVEHENGKTEFLASSDGYVDEYLKIPTIRYS